MVRIIDYKTRTSEDGKEFFTLEIQGGIEMVLSQTTGNFYATARKSSITTTFNEQTCKALIGTEMPGSIEKQECEPYEYTVEDTGEIITLTHKYMYVPESATPQKQNVQKHSFDENKLVTASSEVFSQNGILEPTV